MLYKVVLTFIYLTSLSEMFLKVIGIQSIGHKVTYRCKKDWWKFEDRCYRILDNLFTSKSYDISVCASANSELFIPSSPEEFNAVSSYLSSLTAVSTPTNPIESPIVAIWIGCDDEEEEGTFKCTDGTMFNSSSEWWDTSKPANDPGVNCVYYNVQKGKLLDISCSDQYQALCEADAILHKVTGGYRMISKTYGGSLKGYCLKGHTLFSAKVTGLVHCAGLCLSREACLSFNFQENLGNCEINGNTLSAAGASSLEERAGCNHYELI